MLRTVRTRHLAGCIVIRLAAWQAVTPTWQFLDGTAFLQFGKHFEQGAAVRLPDAQLSGNLVD